MKTFDDFGLSQPILDALAREGHTTPTPIQTRALAPLLDGRDLLGLAQTGSGKTAAFALPILQRLFDEPGGRGAGPRALVLTPTRELAEQVRERFAVYGGRTGLSVGLVIGGAPINRQQAMLRRGVDILVATPGRLEDLMKQRSVTLDSVQVLVLDEVDQMLDMGFIHTIRRLCAALPQARQNVFFSATMPREIARFANALLNSPVKIEIDAGEKPKIHQSAQFIAKADKPDALLRLIGGGGFESGLVFTRTKHGADKVVKILNRAGEGAHAIHGNRSQSQRQRALRAFKSGEVRVLVATDIAARGIDIKGLTHVVNYDLPMTPETYVHRIGRTGRAGATGTAITFCDRSEFPQLRAVEKLIGTRLTGPASGDHKAPGHASTDDNATTASAYNPAINAGAASGGEGGGVSVHHADYDAGGREQKNRPSRGPAKGRRKGGGRARARDPETREQQARHRQRLEADASAIVSGVAGNDRDKASKEGANAGANAGGYRKQDDPKGSREAGSHRKPGHRGKRPASTAHEGRNDAVTGKPAQDKPPRKKHRKGNYSGDRQDHQSSDNRGNTQESGAARGGRGHNRHAPAGYSDDRRSSEGSAKGAYKGRGGETGERSTKGRETASPHAQDRRAGGRGKSSDQQAHGADGRWQGKKPGAKKDGNKGGYPHSKQGRPAGHSAATGSATRGDGDRASHAGQKHRGAARPADDRLARNGQSSEAGHKPDMAGERRGGPNRDDRRDERRDDRPAGRPFQAKRPAGKKSPIRNKKDQKPAGHKASDGHAPRKRPRAPAQAGSGRAAQGHQSAR